MNGELRACVDSRRFFCDNGPEKPCTAVFRLVVQKSRRESAHAQNFQFKSPPKGRACVDSRRDFWTTNLKTAVAGAEMNRDEHLRETVSAV